MSGFLNRPLGQLERLYRFVGGLRSSSSMDIEAPVTVVHDVSRGAELHTVSDGLAKLTGASVTESRARNLPYFLAVEDHVHVGIGIITSEIAVYDGGTSTAWANSFFSLPDPANETVWVLGAYAQITAAVMVEAVVAANPGLKAGDSSGSAPWQLIYSGAGQTAGLNSGERLGVNFNALDTPNNPPYPIPLLSKLGNQLSFMSNVSAAGTVDFFVRCLRLPNGVLPPGLV